MNLILLSPALILLAWLAYTRYRAAIILITALLPAYLLRTKLFDVPTNFLELAILIALMIGFLQPNVRTSWRAAWQSLPRPVAYLVITFIAASLVSVVISPHLLTSLGILKGWIIFPIILAWLIYALPNPTKHQPSILSALVVSGVAMSLFALTQMGSLSRIQGIYDVPNSLALFLTPLLIIALWRRYIFASVIIGLALLATQSVTAIIAVTATLFIGILFWLPRPIKSKAIIGLALFVLVITFFFVSTGRLNYLARPLFDSDNTNSISVRLQLWSVSADIIRDHPLLGIGLGTFEPTYQDYLGQRQGAIPEYVFRDPHNWILSFWINTGVLGLAAFIAIHIYSFSLNREKARMRVYQATWLALISLLIFGLADTIFWKNDLAALHFILLALLISPPACRPKPWRRLDKGELEGV